MEVEQENKEDERPWFEKSKNIFSNEEKCDFWGNHGSKLEIFRNNVRSAKEGDNTIYSKHCINSNGQVKHLWEFKILKRRRMGYDFAIGISSEMNNCERHYAGSVSQQSYMFVDQLGNSYRKRNDSTIKNETKNYTATKKFGVNDIFVCELNLIDKTMTYYHNGNNLGIAFENIETGNDINYFLAVSLYGKGSYGTEIAIEKYTVYGLTPTIGTQYLQNVLSTLDESMIKLNEFKTELTNGNLIKTSKLGDLIKMSENFEKNEEISKQIVSKSEKLDKLIKEIKIQFKNILTPKVSDYKKWELKDILIWINSLENGKYSQHCKLIEKAFREDDVKGADLPDITRADLKGFGINVFRDRVALEKHFQNLANVDVEGNVEQT